jgi:hypothetical protein
MFFLKVKIKSLTIFYSRSLCRRQEGIGPDEKLYSEENILFLQLNRPDNGDWSFDETTR